MIYLTGATGFIGSRVAHRLLDRGDAIRCLVRSRSRGEGLGARGAELVVGDVTDRAVHTEAMQGATAAIHLAASYQIGIVDRQTMQRTNVDGTHAFLAATEETRLPRAVYISTTAALGPRAGEPDEPREAYDGPYPTEYHRTKVQAHRLAREAQLRGVPLVIVCPAFVYGPGDEGPVRDFILELIHRKLPALLSTPSWFSYVYVDDAAAGIVAALDHGTIGEVYLLTGHETSMNDFSRRIVELAGVKGPPLRLPASLARTMGALLDPVARVTGLRFPITREGAKIASRDRWLHKHERATRDLAWAPRTLESGLPPTVADALGHPGT